MSYTVETNVEWRGKEVKIKGKKVVGKSAFEIGLVVEGQARLLAPVKTGLLAGSITTQSQDKGSPQLAPATNADVIAKPQDDFEVLVGTPVDYGPWVEFGTINMDAQPFLRPSLDLAKGKTLTIVEKHGRMEFQDYLK